MSNENNASGGCTLEVARLFERVNAGRKMRSLPPVEKSAMASRCNLRFNLEKKRGIDFNQETIVIAPDDVDALEQLLNEQFDCMLEGIVAKLCIKPKETSTTPISQVPELIPQPKEQIEVDTGLMTKIKKIFG